MYLKIVIETLKCVNQQDDLSLTIADAIVFKNPEIMLRIGLLNESVNFKELEDGRTEITLKSSDLSHRSVFDKFNEYYRIELEDDDDSNYENMKKLFTSNPKISEFNVDCTSCKGENYTHIPVCIKDIKLCFGRGSSAKEINFTPVKFIKQQHNDVIQNKNKEKRTMIISAFPCCGKTTFKNNCENLKISDSDSSNYSWIVDADGTHVRNPEFPKNYINHIKSCIGDYDIVFVSSHDKVRKALSDAGISYTLIYPVNSKSTMDEYINRATTRGSSEEFIETMCNHWDEWISSCDKDANAENKFLFTNKDYIDKDFINTIIHICIGSFLNYN